MLDTSMTMTMTTTAPEPMTVDASALEAELRAELSGCVLRPDDPEYDRAREVWNAAVDRHPALVVLPLTAEDVSRTIKAARRHGMAVTVKSGGHDVAGASVADGAVLIDLSLMKNALVDPAACTVRAEAGLKAGELLAATYPYGLAVPTGDNAAVGIGGLTLGGGIGWLVRKYGLTIDHVLAVELVTANGEITRASAEENADLFWALRGGGGNFGIVTAFEYRLEPVSTVLGGMIVYPGTEAREVVRGWTEYALNAPDGLTTIGMILPAPPLPFIPAEWHGRPIVVIEPVFVGDLEEGARAVALLKSLGTPIVDMVAPMPYPAVFRPSEAAAQHGFHRFVRSTFLPSVDDGLIEEAMVMLDGIHGPTDIVQIRPLGGAMARMERDAAFLHGKQNFLFAIFGESNDAAEGQAQRAWVDRLYAVASARSSGAYANFLGDEGEGRIREAYGPSYDRLAAIKAKYDPENFFRFNQNIKPAR